MPHIAFWVMKRNVRNTTDTDRQVTMLMNMRAHIKADNGKKHKVRLMKQRRLSGNFLMERVELEIAVRIMGDIIRVKTNTETEDIITQIGTTQATAKCPKANYGASFGQNSVRLLWDYFCLDF